MTIKIAILCMPLLLLPLMALGLRPLFDLFLREGVEVFGQFPLRKGVSVAVARAIAMVNAAIFAATWIAAFGCHFLGAPQVVSAALPAVGVVAALVVTIRTISDQLGIGGHRAWLVGLLAWAGGNLPIFLVVPAALALS